MGVVALTALASTSVIAATAASADTHTPSANAESAGHGHALWLDALGLDVAGTGSALSEFPDNVGPNGEDLDLSVLSALTVDIGTGVNIPLIGDGTNGGLLNLGGLGAISSFSESADAQNSVASAGLIGEDGGISLDPESVPADFDRATLDASGLLRQVLPDVLVDTALDEASVSIGALASRAEAVDGQPTSEYLLSGVGLDVHSPVVGNLTTTVDSALGTLLAPLNALVGPGGTIQNTLGTLITSLNGIQVPLVAQVNASLNSLSLDTTPLTNEIRSSLLAEPLENAEGSLSIDLSTGVIHVDLDNLLTDGGGAVGLSSLDPNTNLLSGEAVTSIVDGVTELLLGNGPNSLITKVVNLLNEGIYNVAFNISLQIRVTNPLTGLVLVNAPVTLATNLGGLTGQPGYTPAVFDVSGITVAGIPVGTIVQPIANLLAGTVSTIGAAVLPVVQNLLTNAQPVLTTAVGAVVNPLLDDALEPVLSNLLEVTVNEQPAEGDLGAGSFTVRALAIELLPILGAGSANLQLGSSTVISAEAEATLAASPNPVEQGGVVTLTGGGFTAGEDVTVTFPDATATTVTAQPDGSISTTWDVPADYAIGAAAFSAVGATSGLTATAETEVVAASDATLEATPDPVEQGGTVTLNGDGFDGDEDVTVTLPDGTTTTVTAEADGSFTTTWDVPANFPVGPANFSATGVTSGATATASVEVEAAADALLEATPDPVAHGGTVTVAGGGFDGGEDVTVTFPDGTTTTVTTEADGSFTTTWDVPGDFPTGEATFSATGATSGLTATATTNVVAAINATLDASPNPVEQEGTVTLTGGGFASGEDVTVTFPDGTTTVVTAEADGTISATWDVPADYPAGPATFEAEGQESGATGTATTEVEALAGTLTATPDPVEQGGTVTLTGGGFVGGEDVTVTLPDGTTTTVTAEADGSFTTTWDVPFDFAPGDAEFSATGDASGRTAAATTEVEAASAATLGATPNPVEQEGTVTLSGEGFADGEDVTVTLPDGTTVTVTAEADGSFTTTWEVPADYAPGSADFSAEGETSGRTATATTEVEALAGTLTATPDPVEQGGTVTLTGGGFVGGEDVTVTLPDGTTTTVTAEADGTFSTTWDVPADFATGDAEFTATGDTSGRTATATTEVEAAADADVNANASASASASAEAAADDDATAS
uniref:choice-of-anchor G family protein n=1 Tax=Leucobacter japonicus TaxID=1461259 RepID=UPI0006A771F5